MSYRKETAKNRGVELLSPTRTPDGIGGYKQSYIVLIQTFANIKTESKRIAVAKQQFLNRIIIEATIHYYSNFMAVEAIRFDQKVYRVQEKENINGANREVRFLLIQE